MHRRVFISMAGAFALAGCGGFRQSRLNPGNWFGRSRSRPRDPVAGAPEGANPLIPERGDTIFARRVREEVYEGTPVDQITALEVARTREGAIIRAVGETARLDAHAVRLVSEQPDGQPVGGVLSFELRAIQNPDAPTGPARARQVMAAVMVTNQTLEGARTIRVRGARNERVSQR